MKRERCLLKCILVILVCDVITINTEDGNFPRDQEDLEKHKVFKKVSTPNKRGGKIVELKKVSILENSI